MASQSALEQLCPELQIQILSYSDSFATLYDFIRASPRLYQIFRSNKEYTLSSVARRQCHYFAIYGALMIDRLTLLQKPPFSRETLLKCFEDDSHLQNQAFTAVLPLSVSIRLCRLDTTVRFFIEDYCLNTLPILTRINDPAHLIIQTHYTQEENETPLHLSESELSRLRRAFYRFEIYRQLFARCSSDQETHPMHTSRSLTVLEQGQLFFQTTPLYQVAELACVRDYLYRRIRGIFNLAEDVAVDALQAECPNPKTLQEAEDWDSATGRGYGVFYDDACLLFSILGKPDQHYYIEHLLSLGLPHIRTVIQAIGHERESLLLRKGVDCYAQYETEFLTAALGLEYFLPPYAEIFGRSRRKRDWCLSELDRRQAPSGWLWAHTNGEYCGLVDRSWKGLRDWGYVFWDLERLQQAGILDRKPHDLRKVVFNERLAANRPSVEERWIGTLALKMGRNEEDEDEEDEQTEDGEVDEVDEVDEEDEEDEDDEQMDDGEVEEEEEQETGHERDKVCEREGRTAVAEKVSALFKKLRKWLRHAFGAIVKSVKALGPWKVSNCNDRD